jgi:hypothetical protein
MNTDHTEPRFWATGRFVRVRRRAGRVVLCLIFVEALLAAEFATYFGAPLLGIAAHLTILVGLVAASAMSGRGLRSLWLALTLAPLFRIVSIMIQMPEISRVYWYVIGSIPVLVGAFYVMRVLEYRPRDVGLTFASPVIQLLGVPLGIYLAVLGYTVLQTDTLFRMLCFLPWFWWPQPGSSRSWCSGGSFNERLEFWDRSGLCSPQ